MNSSWRLQGTQVFIAYMLLHVKQAKQTDNPIIEEIDSRKKNTQPYIRSNLKIGVRTLPS